MRPPIGLMVGMAMASGPSIPALASDPRPPIAAIWTIQPAPLPEGELVLAGGQYVMKQRLLPHGLAQLDASVTLGPNILEKDAQLIQVSGMFGPRVYCSSVVSKQKLIGNGFQPCLVDEDRNGDFEAWFNTISQTKALLSVTGRMPKRTNAIAVVTYRQIDPALMRDEYFIAIDRRNYFNIYGRESFLIAFGKEDGVVETLTSPVAFKSSEMPKPVSILGAQFTAISELEGKMRIRVEKTMPQQPFGVVVTTTYSIY